MVYDFRLTTLRLFEAIGAMAARGGMLQVHCEDPVLIDSAVAAAFSVVTRYRVTTPTTRPT